MPSNSAIVFKITADIKDINTSLGQLNANVDQMAANVGGKMDEMGRKVGGVSGAFAKLGLAIQGVQQLAMVFQRFGGAAVDFDTKMREVSTLIDTTDNQFYDMSRTVRDMSRDIPKSAADLAGGLYQVISAGIGADKAISFLGISARAAVAGITDTYTAVDAITSVINAYGMAAEDAQHVSDIFFQTVKDGKTTFGELAPTLGQVIPVAATFGVTFEEVAAAFATLTASGVPTARAATSIGRAISEIVTPGSKAEKAIRQLKDANGDLIYTSGEAALKQASLQKVIDQLSKSGMNMAAVFGDEAARAALTLANNSERASRELKRMREEVTGATQEAFEKMRGAFLNAGQDLMNSFNAAMINLSEYVFPPVIAGIKVISGAFQHFGTTVATVVVSLGTYNLLIGRTSVMMKAATVATNIYRLAVIALNRGFVTSISAMRSFKATLVSTGVGAAVIALGLLAEKFIFTSKTSEEATDSVEGFKKEISDLQKVISSTDIQAIDAEIAAKEKSVSITSKLLAAEKSALDKVNALRLKMTEAFRAGNSEEVQRLAEKIKSEYGHVNAIKEKIAAYEEQLQAGQKDLDMLRKRKKELADLDIMSEEELKAQEKLQEIYARRTASLDDDIAILKQRQEGILGEKKAIEDLTSVERLRYEALQDQINRLLERKKSYVEQSKAFEQSLADKEFELDLRRKALAGATEMQILQSRAGRLEAQIQMAQAGSEYQLTLIQRLAEIEMAIEEQAAYDKEELAQAELERKRARFEMISSLIRGEGYVYEDLQDRIVAKATETTSRLIMDKEFRESTIAGIEEKWEMAKLAIKQLVEGMKSLMHRRDLARSSESIAQKGTETAVTAVKAGVEVTEEGAKMPFPFNLVAIPAGILAVLSAIGSIKGRVKSLIKMESGGVVNQPQLALIGESVAKTGPELVMPERTFNKYMDTQILPNILSKVSADMSGVESRLDRVEKAILSRPAPSAYEIADAVVDARADML